MKDKLNKAIATGLIALMIANFTACDEANMIDNDLGLNNQVTTSGQGANNGDNVTPGNNGAGNNNQTTAFASGPIWDALKNNLAMTRTKFPYENTDVEGYAIPTTFLKEEGLLYFDKDRNCLKINDYKGSSIFKPFQTVAYVDENTSENDIYLIVQYQNKAAVSNQDNPDTFLATWQLKYTLSDEDYATFFKMQGDWRIRLFVQEMDKQYEPEVISKSVICYDLLKLGSHVRDNVSAKNGFPYIFVTDVDYANQILTYGAMFEEGIRYIKVDMRKSNGWQSAKNRYNLTDEECEQLINMDSKYTILGTCLQSFDINGYSGGLTNDQAKEAFNTTEQKAILTKVDVNTITNGYDYNKLVK